MNEQPVHSMEVAGPEKDVATTQDRKYGMDMSYVKSIIGMLKGSIMGWSLLAFIVCLFAGVSIINIFFGIVVFSGLFLTVGLFYVMAFSKADRISRINIYLFDFLVSVVGTVAYFIVCMASVFNILNPVMVVAAVFGFLAMASLAISSYHNFKRYRSTP